MVKLPNNVSWFAVVQSSCLLLLFWRRPNHHYSLEYCSIFLCYFENYFLNILRKNFENHSFINKKWADIFKHHNEGPWFGSFIINFNHSSVVSKFILILNFSSMNYYISVPLPEKPVIQDNKNGTYDVTYVPNKEGANLTTNVKYDNKPIPKR